MIHAVASPGAPPAARFATLIAYYRVSTHGQGRSGLGLEAQRETVASYAGRHGRIVSEFTEIESGRNCERPQLAQAVNLARAQRATLVVAKLDRLARDAAFLLRLLDSGVTVAFCDLPELSSDPIMGRLLATVLAAIAEFEARRIGQRIREACAVRRKRGDKMGASNPKSRNLTAEARLAGVTAAAAEHKRRRAEFVDGLRPVIEPMLAKGWTAERIAEALNDMGIETRTGRAWTPANVGMMLKRGIGRQPPTLSIRG